MCRTSIQQNEAVWFGCEVGKRNVAKQGYLDLEVKIHFLEKYGLIVFKFLFFYIHKNLPNEKFCKGGIPLKDDHQISMLE